MRPIQLNCAVLNWIACDPEQFLGRRGLADVADRRAVFRRRLEQIVRRLEAAGAGQVLRHDVGLAGNMLAEMTRDEPAVDVVAGAGPVSDRQRDGAARERLLGLGRDGPCARTVADISTAANNELPEAFQRSS